MRENKMKRFIIKFIEGNKPQIKEIPEGLEIKDFLKSENILPPIQTMYLEGRDDETAESIAKKLETNFKVII